MEDCFLKLDEELKPLAYSSLSGSTASVVIITQDKIYSANVGDSRSVLKRGIHINYLSEDHKPDVPKEEQRIVKAGH